MTAKTQAQKENAGGPDAEALRRILHAMKLARQAEHRIDHVLYRQGKIVGGVYVGRGQEAMGAASAIQLRDTDVALPSHRDFPTYLLRGFSLKEILLNMMARAAGPTRGRDNMLHVGRVQDRKIIPLIAHLGDTLPVACGAALALKQRKDQSVVLVHFGEGTTSRGDVHEAMNFASVLNLPILFICNNNAYAYSTPTARQYRVKDLSVRAASYDMPGLSLDGNDVLAVYDEVGEAISRARGGGGPSFLVCNTFRMSGHSAHDAAEYMPPELLRQWEKRDPIQRFEKHLLARKVMTRDQLEELQQKVIREVDDAVSFAESSPFPRPESVLEGVFCSDDCWWKKPL